MKGEDGMNLSLMSFSMYKGYLSHEIDAACLAKIAVQSGIQMVDLLSFEVDVLGEAALQTAFAESGVSLGCYIVGASFYEAPEKVAQELTAAFERTRRFGAEILMVVPGAASPREAEICGAMTRQELLDRAVVCFRLAVELGKQYGITVGFENTPHAYKPLASPEDCLYVLENVPGLGFIFDTGNFRVADSDCDELAAYELLKERIIRVHLKDVVVGDFSSGELCTDGQCIRTVCSNSGVIPMEQLIGALVRDGYTGDLSIEYSAPEGINGLDHVPYIAGYCRFIREVMNGKVMRPPYAQIPGIPIPVSRLFFGTAIMPIAMGKECNALFDSIYACGINAFDCARGYGLAEKSLGQWVKDRNNRNRVVILTKCGNLTGNGVCVNRQVILKELEESLAMLQMDYVDILLLHRDDPNTPISEIVDTLNEVQRQGKVRVFGVSNWTHYRIAEANAYARSKGLNGFGVSSPNFGLAEQVEDPWGGECVTISGSQNAEARRWYMENGMPVIAYSSLGRGFFSGKFQSYDYEEAKNVLDGPAQKGYLYPCNMERLRRAEMLAQRDGCTVSQVAMRYVFGHEMNTFAIVSTKSAQRMAQNVIAACQPLNAEDIAYLEQPNAEEDN